MEFPRLTALKERGAANGVDGLEEVGPERIREVEPHVAGIRGLWSPRTGVINAPSPAATAWLPIGRVLAEDAAERFRLRE